MQPTSSPKGFMRCVLSTELASQGDTQAPLNSPVFPEASVAGKVPLLLTTLTESLGEREFNLFSAELFLVGKL